MKTELIVAIFVGICISKGASVDWQGASTIRNEIKNRSNPNIRPEELTIIDITFVLTSLNKLNSVTQELWTTFVLHMTWYDPRLVWDTQPGEPEYLVFYAEEVWRPPIVVSNAISGASYLLKDEIVPLRVSSNGTVLWAPRIAPVTTCEIKIAKFPVDEQTCNVSLTPWVHAMSELDLRPIGTHIHPNPTKLAHYHDKAWNVTGVTVKPENDTGVSGIEFAVLRYELSFKRHERFQWVLLIIPFCCIAFLMPLVFLIPSKSQEGKVSYSLTLMLSFQLYLALLQSLLPPVLTEGETNYLAEYTSRVMIFGTVITSVVVLELMVFVSIEMFCTCRGNSKKQLTADEDNDKDKGGCSTHNYKCAISKFDVIYIVTNGTFFVVALFLYFLGLVMFLTPLDTFKE